MSNFHFLIEEWPGIAQEAMEAERFAMGAPIASAVFARRALERRVRWLYAQAHARVSTSEGACHRRACLRQAGSYGSRVCRPPLPNT